MSKLEEQVEGLIEAALEEIRGDIQSSSCGIDPSAVDELIQKVAWLGSEWTTMSAEISSLEGTVNEMEKELALVKAELDLD